MLTKELLQNPMMMVSSRLFVLSTGPKTSKISTATVLIVNNLCNICRKSNSRLFTLKGLRGEGE